MNSINHILYSISIFPELDSLIKLLNKDNNKNIILCQYNPIN